MAVFSGLVIASYHWGTANLRDLIAVKEEQTTYLESQARQDVARYEDSIKQYKDQISRYEERIPQLEDIADFYRDEADYWKTAYNEKVTGQVVRLCGYNEFSSLEELKQWLEDDPISEHKWHPNYDCDNFAMDLTLVALADGYWIGLGASDNHLFNFTIIGNDIYRIEAHQDKVEPWGTLD